MFRSNTVLFEQIKQQNLEMIERQINSNNFLNESVFNTRYKQKLKSVGMYNEKAKKDKQIAKYAVELHKNLNHVIREHVKQIITDLVTIKQ